MSNTKNQIQNPDITLKFLNLGDSMVGKTSIVLRFVDNVFYEQTKSTIGVDFKTKTINFGNKKIKIKVWDTAGQERFRTITKQYYKNAEGIILIYDVTESKTFDQIEDWVMNIMDNKQSDAKVILVGNKIDCEERVILKEQGAELAKRFDLPYFETSASTGENVNKIFECLAEEILKTKYIIEKNEGHIKLSTVDSPEETKKKKKCC